MCNSNVIMEKTCFGVFNPKCHGNGLGPLICKFFHFFRFTTNHAGKRVLRSNCTYYFMAIPSSIFYPVWISIYLVFGALWWPILATYNVMKDRHPCLSLILCILIWPLMQVLFAFAVFCYIYVFVFCYTMWTMYCAICRYSDTPLSRKVKNVKNYN